jgi:hypothetical protein
VRAHHQQRGEGRAEQVSGFLADVRRVFGAALIARAATLIGTVIGAALPLAWMLATHRSSSHAVHVAVGIGTLIGLFAGTTITSYATRFALLEGLGPIMALRRSLTLTRARPLMTIATGMLVWACYWLALAGVRHLALFLGLALALRWMRDVWLTTRMTSAAASSFSAFASMVKLPSARIPPRPRRGAIAALAAMLMFALATLRSGDAGAQVALITGDGNGAATNGVVTPSQKALTEEDNSAELVEINNKKLFDQANAALVDAQAASDRATQDLVRYRMSVVGAPFNERPSSDVIAAKDGELIKAADAADELVRQRKAALAEAKQRILDKANGGESFGSLQRNLVDIRHTGSFLKGMGSGTITGVADTGRAIGRLAQTASAKLFSTAPPPVEPEAPKLSTEETRLRENQQDLAIDLLRIRDGATANEILGKGAGEEIIATAVTAEIGGALVSRAGSALRAKSASSAATNESALLRNFGEGGEAAAPSAANLRGKQVPLSNGQLLLGPETTVSARGANLTTDRALTLSPEAGAPFAVGVHSTANSLNFTADISGAVTLSPRAVAIRMWKAGYRGGDIKLLACECGLNRALVKDLRKELNGLRLDKPVGTISAPTATVDGTGTLTAPGTWKVFD